MASSYNPASANPSDTSTTNADPTAAAGTTGTFDDLTQFGVSPALEKVPVKWGTVDTPAVPSAGWATPAKPAGTAPKTQTYLESVRYLYGKTPEKIGELQDQLTAGGFLGKNPDIIGNTPDKNTRKGWDQVLQIAMRENKTPDEVLAQAINDNGGLAAGLAKHNVGPAVPDIHLTHPDDIRMVAKQISQKVLGKGWNQKQLDQFVQTYQSMELAQGTAAQGRGATVVNAPGIQAATETAARASNPVAAGATDWDNAAQMMKTAFKTLGGG